MTMTPLPAAGAISGATTVGNLKQAHEDALQFQRQSLGGNAINIVTISGGVITLTQASHRIDTEAAATTDDLVAISTTGVPDGFVAVLACQRSDHVVVVKHGIAGAGRILLAGGSDYSLDSTAKSLTLQLQGSDWVEIGRALAADNPALIGSKGLPATSGEQLTDIPRIGNFAPSQQSTPNMTLKIAKGTVLVGTTIIGVGAQSTATITAPTVNPRNDIVYVDASSGVVGIAAGTEAASPADPAIPSGKLPVARVRLTVGQSSIKSADFDDIRSIATQLTPTPVRQTVLQGAVDSSGLPTFLGSGSGLQPSIDGSSTPIVLTAANGFSSGGPVDRVGLITASTSFPAVVGSKTISSITNSTTTATVTTSTAHGLTTGAYVTVSGATPSAYNGTYQITVTTSTQFTYVMASNPGGNASAVGSYTVLNYLYGDIQSNGSVTLGSTLLAPVYQQGGSYSTTNGQFTFNIASMSGQVGNGSIATQTYRVFIGEALAGASSISSVTAYALQGRYDSGLFAVASNTAYTKNHNLGLPSYATSLNIADDSSGTNERTYGLGVFIYSGSANIGPVAGSTSRNSVNFNTTAAGVGLAAAGGTIFSAFYRIIVKRTW